MRHSHSAAIEAINEAIAVLDASETGKAVHAQLEMFLNGRIGNLDSPGWRAVELLLEEFRSGYAGSVTELLAQTRRSRG